MVVDGLSPVLRRGGSTASVIGAGGFIGGQLVRSLGWAGIPTEILTRRNSFLRRGRLCAQILRSDVIFYLATRISPALAERDPQRVAEDKDEFRALLAGLQDVDHRPVVVLPSSGGTVYDPDLAPPYTEQSRVRATSAYSAVKLFQEHELAASTGWTAPVILRLANVYGPGQRTGAGYGVIGHWMEALLANDRIRILGDVQSRRDYVHVTDVATAMLAVYRRTRKLRLATAPTVLNIGSGTPTSLSELHSTLEYTVGRPIPMSRQPARAFDRRDVWLDIGRAAKVIGWRPAVSLREGLADTWRYQQGISAVLRASRQI